MNFVNSLSLIIFLSWNMRMTPISRTSKMETIKMYLDLAIMDVVGEVKIS